MNLADLIARNAAFTPDKAALRFEGRTITYSALNERITQAARALKSQLGVGRGDRVALLALNHPDYLVLLYACARLGALLLPLNWRLAVPEQMFILRDASAKVLIVEQDFAAVVPALKKALPDIHVVGLGAADGAETTFDDFLASGSGDGSNPHIDESCPLLLVYTSGTTGRPKGAVLRQEALKCNGVMSHHMHDMTAADHILTVLPLFHVGGLNIQTTPALHIGATVTIHTRFAPDATLAAIARDKPTLTVLVPATIQACIAHPAWASTDLSSLRALTTGSTQVPVPLIEAMEARGVPVLQVYGSTETCPVAVYSRFGGDLSRKASTGLPGLLCEARVVDDEDRDTAPGVDGEVLVRGANVFFEYWGNQAATAEALRNGWYHTGDIGMRDAEGYYYIHDRKKNMIISGGENIYPAEVERVLNEHPAIAEAAVIGRPDPKWQEVPVAYVVRRNGQSCNAEAIIAHLSGQLARFKVPREIVFVDTLPRNALGKVQHFMLKEQVAR